MVPLPNAVTLDTNGHAFEAPARLCIAIRRSFRGGRIVTCVVGLLRGVVRQLPRRLFDLIERIAVDSVNSTSLNSERSMPDVLAST